MPEAAIIFSSQTNRWIPKERFSITWDRRTVRIIFVAASNPSWFVEHSPGEPFALDLFK
jgi:hypothetical protein